MIRALWPTELIARQVQFRDATGENQPCGEAYVEAEFELCTARFLRFMKPSFRNRWGTTTRPLHTIWWSDVKSSAAEACSEITFCDGAGFLD